MDKNDTLKDEDLILKAKKGDDYSFEQLVHLYDKQVFSIVAHYVRCTEDAKDIYQEVFIRVYKGLPKFDFRAEFSTWLYRITTNVCLSFKSQKKRMNTVVLDEEYSSGEHELNDQNTINENGIMEMIDKLPPKQKIVFNLKHFHGYKFREIADLMNCTEGTVKKYFFIAIRKLREELEIEL